MVRAEALAKAWMSVLIAMAVITLIGLFAIPSGDPVTMQWSWGDWEPSNQAPKWAALISVPAITALIAWGSRARRASEGGDLWWKLAAVDFVVMGLVLVVHAVIVLSASF